MHHDRPAAARRFRAFVRLASLPALAAAAMAGAASAGDLHYRYFEDAIAVELDPMTIVVERRADDGAALGQTLAALRLVEADREPVAVGRWARIAVPEEAQNEEGVRALVARLAATGRFDCVAPVLLDARGEPLSPTRDLLVGFHPGVAPEAAAALIAATAGGAVRDRDFAGLPGVYRWRGGSADGFALLEAANALALRPETRFAEPDFLARGVTSHIPNDPLFSGQWALNQGNDQDLDGPEAWDLERGDPAVQVVILDVGIQQGHPDLNQLPGQDFTGGGVAGGGPANECDDHGTAVGGCVSAIMDNGIGVTGIAPECVVRSGKIGNSTSFFGFCLGTFDSQPSMLASALSWSVSIGARATNSSFSYTTSSTVATAYANARANGVAHFAATGNGGGASIAYPASLPSINAIGALDASGARASFSQYGAGITYSSPGADIDSTDRTGNDGYQNGDYVTGLDGTSFASPYAAGVAALVIAANPALTVDEVEQILADTATDLGAAGYDTVYGWGFLNAFAAVQAALPPACAADVDGNGAVEFADLVAVLAAWGPCPGCPADVDGDDTVGFTDIVALLAAWGPC